MKTNRSAIHLWNEFRKGEVAAFSELYSSFYADLLPYALKICKDSNLARDAIHNTYVNLWNNKGQLGEVASVKFYLLRSIRHECLFLLKKQKHYTSLDQVEIETEIVIEPDDLQLNDAGKVSTKRIKEALLQLSSRQQEIVYLKFYNNLDYEEIAELLSLNYQSVVNSIHRSMVKLRKQNVLGYFKNSENY